ncbi:AGAP008754-PA, partial [Anopheles gambiae str. PEST]
IVRASSSSCAEWRCRVVCPLTRGEETIGGTFVHSVFFTAVGEFSPTGVSRGVRLCMS